MSKGRRGNIQESAQWENSFRRELIGIALPVTLQSLLQSSFAMVDQLMIGQLGSESIAGIGLGGKFASITQWYWVRWPRRQAL